MRCSLRNFIGILVSILKVTESTRTYHMQRRSQCGDYPCKAPRIKVGPKNATLSFGETHSLRCRAQGNPVPTITWEKNRVRIDRLNRNFRITTSTLPSKNKRAKVVKSQLRIQRVEVEDEAKYACIATNSVKSVRSIDSYIALDPETAGNPAKIPGSTGYDYDTNRIKQCIPYINGTTCSRYLDPSRSIFTANGKETLFVLENMLSTLVPHLQDNSMHLSSLCQPHVLPFLCYYNFPYCAKNTREHTKVNICRKDCARISSHYCHREFAMALQEDIMKTLIPKNCMSLPTQDCLSMEDEIDRVQHLLQKKSGRVVKAYRGPKSSAVDATDNCYFSRGEHYRGIVNYTESDLPCMRWSRTMEGSQYAELLAGHNYCRNIGSKHERPWCYVRHGGMKPEFGYCNVPRCATPVRAQATNILYTIIPCLVFALALSLAIIIVAWKRHKQHYYQSAPSSPKQVVPRVNPKIEELNREDMCDFRLLGDGSIGRVYTADYTGCKDGKTFTACVAVKAIIEKASPKQIEDFVREAETRANFKHENIVSLIGVISNEEPLSLIYEYTECGDLHEYLLRHSPNFSDAHANDDFGPLEYPDLLVIATQISSGMSYLSTHAFVHKDLAARNCLVTGNGIIKISDFSGLRDLYAGDYYRAPGRPPLPVRWMSPEALSQYNFTNASDVWSYGVTLWEIFSYGSRPFFGFSNYEAMNLIAEYELVLPSPEGCPPPIFAIMQDCWTKSLEGRPSFVEIYNRLKSMDDIAVNPPMHHELSVPSLTANIPNINGYMGREVAGNPFHRPSISSGRSHSLQSGHSSTPSTSSGHHPASVQSASQSIPPSLISVPHPSLMHQITSRNGHHTLPHDGYISGSRENHCPRDPHYARPSSANSSSLHRSSGPHSNGFLPPGSYMSSLQSYPPSMGCPPTMFSRQSSSRTSNHESSGYDSIKRGGNQANVGHIYL